jgi:regulator of replication initiation timing
VGGNETRTRGARTSEAIDRDALLDRLHQLRTVIPAFAQELADVRRTAARLRTDNRRLLAEVHRLRRERGESQAKQRLTLG